MSDNGEASPGWSGAQAQALLERAAEREVDEELAADIAKVLEGVLSA